MSNEFEINKFEKCVSVNKNIENVIIYFFSLIDKLIIIGSDNNMIKITKKFWNSMFDMKDIALTDMIWASKLKKKKTLNNLIPSQDS